MDFTPTAMSTANCLFSLSNSSVTDAYFNLYIDNRGFLGLEVRNHGETRYVNLQVRQRSRAIPGISWRSVRTHRKATSSILMATWFSKCLWPFMSYGEYDYRFMSTVNSADVGYMGATYRNGSFGYPLLRHHRQRACL